MGVRRWLLIVLCVLAAWVLAQDVHVYQARSCSPVNTGTTTPMPTAAAWPGMCCERCSSRWDHAANPHRAVHPLGRPGPAREVDGWVGSYRDEVTGRAVPALEFRLRPLSTPLGWQPPDRRAWLRWANTAWPGCAAIVTKTTCPMCAALTRSSAATAFCRCSSRAVQTSTSTPGPRSKRAQKRRERAAVPLYPLGRTAAVPGLCRYLARPVADEAV